MALIAKPIVDRSLEAGDPPLPGRPVQAGPDDPGPARDIVRGGQGQTLGLQPGPLQLPLRRAPPAAGGQAQGQVRLIPQPGQEPAGSRHRPEAVRLGRPGRLQPDQEGGLHPGHLLRVRTSAEHPLPTGMEDPFVGDLGIDVEVVGQLPAGHLAEGGQVALVVHLVGRKRFQSLQSGSRSRKAKKRNRRNICQYFEDCASSLTPRSDPRAGFEAASRVRVPFISKMTAFMVAEPAAT